MEKIILEANAEAYPESSVVLIFPSIKSNLI